MEQTIYNQIVVPVVKFLTGHVTKILGYVISSSKHVTDMKEQLRVLRNESDNVKNKMAKNKMDNKEIPPGISRWVNDVETFMNNVESMSSEGYGCFNIKMRHRVGKKACEDSKRMEDFIKKKEEFKWTNARIPIGLVDSEPPTSTPSSHGIKFNSRESSFSEALKWLKQDDNKSKVLALCGMGGVGKTTMMEQLRMVANDKNMFDYIVPVVIGRTPNILSIQNDIALHIASEGLVEATVPVRADGLCKRFKKILEEKKERILVILDDVWEKIELKEIGLTSPLPNGLKLLLTSRDSNLCRQIAVSAHSNFEEVKVNVLEEEEARKLFFGITNVSEEDDLYAIGCQIVKKCGGLPLAINIIGRTLSQEECDWNTTLRRLKNNDVDRDVEEVMKISYEYIKHEEDKEVFLLCGLFPEDYNIQIEDLTRYAWGLNLFKGVSTLEDARDSTKACVRNLINAHLLINCDGCVKIHDLVLAFVLDVVSKSDRAWIINHGNVTQLTGREEMVRESCKRISLTCMGMSEFPQDFKYPNLSLLQLMSGDFSLKFPKDFYENMKSLQVVAYYNMQYPLLPRSLYCSTNLKSLCLYECKLMFDFSFVGDLVNLEVLSFAHCDILKLPSAIGKLVKLKLLDLTGCMNLCIDNGVFINLKNLEELYMRVSFNQYVRFTESNIKELAMLSKQLFALEVEFVEKENLFEFSSFDKLDKFKIAIGGCFYSSPFEKDPFVNKLKLVSDCKTDLHNCKIKELFKKTEHLELQVNDMIDLEDFRYDRHSFSSLKCLMVYGCSKLKYLFPVCVANGLKKLEKLLIQECPVLEALIKNDGSEINGVVELPQLLQLGLYHLPNFTSIYPDNSSSMCALFNSQPKFPKLEKLDIQGMKELKQIWSCEFGSSEKEEVNNFSMLREIYVRKCDSLVNLFPSNPMRLLTHLERLVVFRCGSIKELFNIDLEYNGHEVENNFSMLREIIVYECDSLVNLFPSNPMRLFTQLESLDVRNCGSIKELFNIDLKCIGHEGENNFSMLREIEVDGCDSLVNLFPSNPMRLLTHLEKLQVRSCNSIKELFNIDLEWNGVEVVFDIDVNNQQQLLPNLTSIEIYKCNMIKYLFSPLMAKPLSNLHKIKVDECRDMEEVVSNRDDDDDDKDEEEMSIGGGGQSNGTKTSVIQHKVSHVGVVSWSLCQFSKEIIISSCNGLSSVIPLDAIGQMQKLEVLRVEDCESLKEVFESQYINGNSGDSKSSININKGSVDIDAISRQSNINMAPLSNLKKLVIISCNLLQHVFTFFMLESLKHLEELKIKDCKAMKVIVEKENEEQTKDVVFRSLKLIKLHSLPNLEGFFLGMNNFNWPLLEKVKIIECPQMMNFTCGESTTRVLVDIHTSLGRRSLECGLNFHHLKIHQTLSVHNLIDLQMKYDKKVKCIIPSDELLQLQNLETIKVCNCELVEEVFEVEGKNEGTNSESEIFVEIPKLRLMNLWRLKSLKYIWKSNKRKVLKFPNLTTLFICSCESIKHVFTSSMVGGLLQLQDLHVEDCKNMEVIVKIEEEDEVKEEIELFPCLKSLKLYRLESLKGFCSGKVNVSWPLLHTLEVPACPEITDMLLLQH